MALNPLLKELADNDKLGFEDVFELYAMLCVMHISTVTNDIIEDEGIKRYIESGGATTVEELTAMAVDWAHNIIPEMIVNVATPGEKKQDESWLQFVIRSKIEAYVKETKALQLKVN